MTTTSHYRYEKKYAKTANIQLGKFYGIGRCV